MVDDIRTKIRSNDFLDMIVEYNGSMQILNRFPQGTVHIMNDIYAVVYEPIEIIGGGVIQIDRYSLLPSCYGLTSQAGFAYQILI